MATVSSSNARAQQDAENHPAGPLDEVRELVALRDVDLKVIDTWLLARIDELKQSAQDDARTGASAFLSAFARQRANPANSGEFNRQFAARAGAAFAAEFGRSEPLSDEVVWPMARILLDMGSADTGDALAAGLRHESQTVRYLCASAYPKLQSTISADRDLARSTITILRDRAMQESNQAVLGAIYRALRFSDYVQEAARAIGDVLAARVAKRQSGEVAVAERAELDAWEFLRQGHGQIPEAARAQLVRPLAAMIALDVNRYAEAPQGEKLIIEERIEVGEGLLEDLVGRGAGGNIRKAMKEGGTSVEINMQLELVNWVGAEGQDGILNKAPWNVPRGGLPTQPRNP